MTPSGTDDLVASLDELAALLLATPTVTDALQQVADDAVRHVPAATGCGLTLLINDQLSTAATTGATPARLDQEQYDRGQGPCLDAAHSGWPTLVADFATERPWADYPAVAIGCGMRSLYSEPVWAPQVLGALNLYARRSTLAGGRASSTECRPPSPRRLPRTPRRPTSPPGRRVRRGARGRRFGDRDAVCASTST